jgi:probable O-glycosylation ligase (exosortase A-associated)
MNPHRLAWGFMTAMPWAMIVGVLTFAAWIFSKENKKLPMTPVTVLMIFFVLWCTITTTQAYASNGVWEYWLRYVKIMSMIFLTMIVIQDRQRLQALIWVIVVSIGFYGFKGGLFGLITGGDNRVWGPEDSFISDNNALAMALIMIIPFVRYLQLNTKDRRIRLALLGSIPLLIMSVLASYSRGAFVGMSVMMLFLAMKSKHRLGYGLVIVVALAATLSFMPDKYYERLQTTQTEAEMGTSSSRLASWQFAINVASASPVFGGGFLFFDSPTLVQNHAPPAAIQTYTPQGPLGFNMHSIYFEVLGTQGYVGLLTFLLIFFLAYRNCAWVKRRTKHREDLGWTRDLASMTQVSIIGTCSAGAFQNLAFFDLLWHVISITVIVRLIAERELRKPAAAPDAAPEPDRPGRRPYGRPVPRPVPATPGSRPVGAYRRTSTARPP